MEIVDAMGIWHEKRGILESNEHVMREGIVSCGEEYRIDCLAALQDTSRNNVDLCFFHFCVGLDVGGNCDDGDNVTRPAAYRVAVAASMRVGIIDVDMSEL